MSADSNGMVPQLNPQIAKDWQDYEIGLEQYKADCAEIQRLAAALATMKNPMFGVQEVMSAVMNMSGDQISSLSSLDNLDTDLRNLLQGAQNGFNGLGSNDPNSTQDAQGIVNNIDQLENFIKWQQSLGKDSAFDSGPLSNMQSAIDSIKGAFGKDWGDTSKMAQDVQNWNGSQFQSLLPPGEVPLPSQAPGQYSPQLNTIQGGFQTLNQSTSAFSTSTNTKLQFKTEQYKQYLGIDQSSIQAYLKLTAAMIQNEKTS